MYNEKTQWAEVQEYTSEDFQKIIHRTIEKDVLKSEDRRDILVKYFEKVSNAEATEENRKKYRLASTRFKTIISNANIEGENKRKHLDSRIRRELQELIKHKGGERRYTVDDLQDICKAFQTTPDALFNLSSSQNRQDNNFHDANKTRQFTAQRIVVMSVDDIANVKQRWRSMQLENDGKALSVVCVVFPILGLTATATIQKNTKNRSPNMLSTFADPVRVVYKITSFEYGNIAMQNEDTSETDSYNVMMGSVIAYCSDRIHNDSDMLIGYLRAIPQLKKDLEIYEGLDREEIDNTIARQKAPQKKSLDDELKAYAKKKHRK